MTGNVIHTQASLLLPSKLQRKTNISYGRQNTLTTANEIKSYGQEDQSTAFTGYT